MPPDDERLPLAWGCGWRYGEEAGCAILSCRRKSPCEGEWADDIYRIIKYGGSAPPSKLNQSRSRGAAIG
jgi:hypothetical protein